jgi:hypothetical protein
MARRRKYQFITDPVLKASVVVEKFVGKAKAELDEWANRYKGEIKGYTADENRQVTAATKLAGFYMGITDPDVRNAIRDAVNRAKARQAEVVSAVLTKLPTPTIPEDVKKTAKKVAEIVGVVAPAV